MAAGRRDRAAGGGAGATGSRYGQIDKPGNAKTGRAVAASFAFEA